MAQKLKYYTIFSYLRLYITIMIALEHLKHFSMVFHNFKSTIILLLCLLAKIERNLEM